MPEVTTDVETYEQRANRSDAAAALLLGWLAERSNPEIARTWYQRANKLGSIYANKWIDRLDQTSKKNVAPFHGERRANKPGKET